MSDEDWAETELPCIECNGEGGYHDCGDDPCTCKDPDADLNERCERCDGSGWE